MLLIDRLTKNNYKELRILNESEAENLCKEVSNLQYHIILKLLSLCSLTNYKDYLSNQQAIPTDSTPTQSNTTTTTKSPKATKESTDSKTLTPNNNNQPPNTFPILPPNNQTPTQTPLTFLITQPTP